MSHYFDEVQLIAQLCKRIGSSAKIHFARTFTTSNDEKRPLAIIVALCVLGIIQN